MTDDNPKPALLDYDDVSVYLGKVSRSKIKELAAKREIVKVRLGGRTMFLRASVDAYIQRVIGE
ncbi:MAG TPA: helix-turn-helix domain-containing protein [Candidatus Cybelea sp.]|jgi:excisionase family DNA binding protein